MRTEEEIKQKGMEALLEALGDVDAEFFIKMLIREPFDYTQWQRDLWTDMDVNSLSEKARNIKAKRKKINIWLIS